MFLQEYPNQIGQRGPLSNRRHRCRSPEISQHPQVEEHNEVVLCIRHAQVSRPSWHFIAMHISLFLFYWFHCVVMMLSWSKSVGLWSLFLIKPDYQIKGLNTVILSYCVGKQFSRSLFCQRNSWPLLLNCDITDCIFMCKVFHILVR